MFALAAIALVACGEADRQPAGPTGTAEASVRAEATPAPTATPTPGREGARRLPSPDEPIDEPIFTEEFCKEIDGEWDAAAQVCSHPSFEAPLPEGTDTFAAIGRTLNDRRSDLRVTEEEFLARWNEYVTQQGIAAEASLDDLGGFDLGRLYFVRKEILTVSLQVYLHEDDGDVATVGVGSFPDAFITWSTWRLAEAAMLGASPELTAEEATGILTTLTAGHEVEIGGVNSSLVRDGVIYRLIDGGGDNGVWLTISTPQREDLPSARTRPGAG